jgi:hypothetical protein
MLRGVDIFSNAVKITLGPKVRNVQILWRAAHDQGRRHRRQGNWAQSPTVRMFAARQLGASTTPVSPKGNCNEQF